MKTVYYIGQVCLGITTVICFLASALLQSADFLMLGLCVLAMMLVAHAGEQQPRVTGSPLPPLPLSYFADELATLHEQTGGPKRTSPYTKRRVAQEAEADHFDEGLSTLLALCERSDEHAIALGSSVRPSQPSPYSA